jgi:hypothetical protein
VIQIKEEGMGDVCSTHGDDEKCKQDFSRKISREELASET